MNIGLIISDFIAVILGILIIGITLLSRGRKFAFRIFNFYIFMLTLLAFQSLLLETKIVYKIPHFFRATMPFRYLIGPAVFLFIRALLLDENKFRKYDWFHLIPFVFHYIILLPFLSSNASIKLEIIKSFEATSILNIPSFNSPLLNPRWHDAINQLSYLIYNIITVCFYLNFRKANKLNLGVNKPVYNFAKTIIFILSIGNLILIPSAFILSDNNMVLLVRLVLSVVLMLFVIILLLHPEFLYSTHRPLGLKNSRNNLLSQISYEEAKLIAMSNSINESNLFLGLDYKVLCFNSLAKEEFDRIFDTKLQIGLDFKEYICPEYINKFHSSFAKAVSGIKNEFYALSNVSKEEKQWYIINFTPIYNRAQILIGISIISQNIDKEIKAQLKTKQYIKDLEDIAWKEVHLLNAPISNLLGITRFLLKPESDISLEEQDILINHILLEVEKLDVVIHDIVHRVNDTVKHLPD